MKRSEELVKQVKTMSYWFRRFYDATWRAKDLETTEADRKLRDQVQTKLWEVDKMIKDHYAAKIGPAIVSEET